MKKLSLLLLLMPIALTFAQTKDYILTLQEQEYFNSDNSQINGTATGYDWKVVTEDDYRHHFEYTKGKNRTPAEIDHRIGSLITMGTYDGLKYLKDNSNGKKYGPYEKINPYTDKFKKKLFAYQYVDEGKTFFVDLREDKTYGPFDKGGLWFIDESNLVYSYNEGDDLYLMENDKKHGPFQQVAYFTAKIGNSKPIMTFKKNDKFYTSAKQCQGMEFDKTIIVKELEEGWLVQETSKEDYYTKWLHLPDGQKLEHSKKKKHLVNFKGQVLRAEHEAGGGSHAAFKVYNSSELLGTFSLKETHREDIALTDFFSYQFSGVTINSPNSSFAKENENYYYSPTQGLVGPLSKDEAFYVYFYSGGFANIDKDSTLYLNGNKMLENIAFAIFRDGIDWYAFQQRGDYVYPFKNGIEVENSELPEKYQHFDTKDQFSIRVKRGSDYFIRVKGKDKLHGPLTKFDQYSVSDDGNHYAVARGRDGKVEVDGKIIGNGYKVSYNPEMNAFHWWWVEGRKVYIYTKKI